MDCRIIDGITSDFTSREMFRMRDTYLNGICVMVSPKFGVLGYLKERSDWLGAGWMWSYFGKGRIFLAASIWAPESIQPLLQRVWWEGGQNLPID
jgi:hypothetical protein